MANDFKAYINGEFITTPQTLSILSPHTNLPIGSVPALSPVELDQAFQAAHDAFNTWGKVNLKVRVKHLEALMALMLEHKHQLADLMYLEVAKSKADGILEVERTVQYIAQTIEAWPKLKLKKVKIGNKTANLHRVALGVVLAISPFNYPINLALSKIAPALLIGNTVVFKPATNGSLTGAFLTELIAKANFPRGVFNLVTGRGRDIGDKLVTHRLISMVSFTGSIPVGKQLAKAQSMIPLVLELGGNDAGYVRADADLKLAAKEVAKGAFSYAGQRCTAIKRLIVAQSIKEAFIPLLLNEVSKLENNPLVTTSAADFATELIVDSQKRGDKFLLSGPRQVNQVAFHIIETDAKSRAWKEEAFGPVLPVITIKDEKKLLTLINDSEFGLQNSLFTSDVKWAKKLAINVESGTVNINRASSRGPDIFPFLGVKNSGFGTQGISDALISMSRILNIVEND